MTIEVSQADMELWERLLGLPVENKRRRDKGFAIVPGFRLIAEHRLASTAAQTAEIEMLRGLVGEAEHFLTRYRNETPLGHQPHMIAHKVDAFLANLRESRRG